MVNGADRLLKDYVNPPTFKNANLKHPEKPGSNLEFLGPSGLFASSHPQICLHLTMTYARRDKYLNPHIQDLSIFSLICKQLPQGNWTGKETWISFQMSLGPFGREFRSMSGGEAPNGFLAQCRGLPCPRLRMSCLCTSRAHLPLSYLLIQIFDFFIVLDEFLPNLAETCVSFRILCNATLCTSTWILL